MFYELGAITQKNNEIAKEIDFVNNKGTDPQSLFVYAHGLGLFDNIKHFFVNRKLLKRTKKQISLCTTMIEHLERLKAKTPDKRVEKRMKKVRKYFDKRKTSDAQTEPDNRNLDEVLSDLKDNLQAVIKIQNQIAAVTKYIKNYIFNALLMCLMPFTVIAYGMLTTLLNINAVNIAATAVFFTVWAAYFAIRLINLIKFARYYKLDAQAKTIKFSYHLCAVFLYFSLNLLFCLQCFGCNLLPATVCLLADCGVLIFAFFYDIFCSSRFFMGELSYTTFVVLAGAVLCIMLFAVKNRIISQIVSGVLISVEIGLLIIIFKAFLIEQRKIETIVQIICTILIVLLTIVLGAVLIYRFTWVAPVNGTASDNTLFSAVMGIYAALIGGLLTFTGVAWTIRHNEQQRKADEKLRVRPYLVNSGYSSKHTFYSLTFNKFSKDGETPVVIKEIFIYITDAADCLILGLMTNKNYYPLKVDAYANRNSYQMSNKINLPQDEDVSAAYIIVKDLLDNIYAVECMLEKQDDGEYKCVDLGVPKDLSSAQLQIFKAAKRS